MLVIIGHDVSRQSQDIGLTFLCYLALDRNKAVPDKLSCGCSHESRLRAMRLVLDRARLAGRIVRGFFGCRDVADMHWPLLGDRSLSVGRDLGSALLRCRRGRLPSARRPCLLSWGWGRNRRTLNGSRFWVGTTPTRRLGVRGH